MATAGFQIEGGFNGPGQPANNWLTWERIGRVEPSGIAADFWAHPEEALDRAAGLGCNSFRLGLEWARVEPREGEIDDTALAGYARILDGCTERGMAPLVTLLHFTHPAWLGDEFWLRTDSPERYQAWVELALGTLAEKCRHWVTINEINAMGLGSWILGMFPPGRRMAFGDAAVAMDNLLAAHVLGYEAIHRARPDAIVTTNNASVTLYEFDALLTDILMARSMGIDRDDLDRWLDTRRARHYAAHPTRNRGEQALRKLSAATAPYGPRRRAPRRPSGPGYDLAHRDGRWTRSTPARTRARSMSWASTTTTRWPPDTCGLPVTQPPEAGGGPRPGSCGTTSPIRPVCRRGWGRSTT